MQYEYIPAKTGSLAVEQNPDTHELVLWGQGEMHLRISVERLRSKSEYSSLPAYLLPAEFTLPELQQAYEVVLGRSVDKSAFRTRVQSADVVEETGAQRPSSSRPAALYRLKQPGALTFFPRTFSPRKE